jgi:hypothetical protein
MQAIGGVFVRLALTRMISPPRRAVFRFLSGLGVIGLFSGFVDLEDLSADRIGTTDLLAAQHRI